MLNIISKDASQFVLATAWYFLMGFSFWGLVSSRLKTKPHGKRMWNIMTIVVSLLNIVVHANRNILTIGQWVLIFSQDWFLWPTHCSGLHGHLICFGLISWEELLAKVEVSRGSLCTLTSKSERNNRIFYTSGILGVCFSPPSSCPQATKP